MSVNRSCILSRLFLYAAFFGVVLMLSVLGASRANAQYIYTILNDPAAGSGGYPSGGTDAYGMYGPTVVGTYFTSDSVAHAFSQTGGVFSNFDEPNATNGTYAAGIDTANGQTIVGLYLVGGTAHGYSYTGGAFQTIDVGSTLTYANGIYNNTIVGIYQNAGDATTHGYSLTNGIVTTIDDPNAGPNGTFATGIYGNTVVGYYRDNNGSYYGFSETNGIYTTIDDPNAEHGTFYGNTDGTEVNGIYGNTLVGNYVDANGVFHGFFESDGVYTYLDPPGSTATNLQGIYGNTFVGGFFDTAGEHGFIAAPTPEPGSVALFAASLSAVGLRLVVRRLRR